MVSKNQILATLSAELYGRLAEHLSQVTVEQGAIVHSPGEPLTQVYFPLDCLFSITLTMRDGATAEVGMVGNREMLGINAVMGDSAITQTTYVAQVGGSAVKMPAAVLKQEFEQSAELRGILLRYSQAFLAQVSQTAACNSLHTLEQRLPRWLLETQERIHSDHLPLTQEFLAHMLGVRRAGVTQIAQKLQERRLIQYHRGNVNILNQAGLEASACECFQAIKTEYNRLLGERPDAP